MPISLGSSPMAVAELEAHLRTVQPAACAMKLRHIRTIQRQAEDDGEPVLEVPGNACWVNSLRVRQFEHHPRPIPDAPGDRLLLVPEPDDSFSQPLPHARELRYYERLLGRAAIVAELQGKFESGELALQSVRDRLASLGAAAETELRFVLIADRIVAPDDDDFVIYRTFAAIYLDLVRFQPAALPWVFPMLAGSGAALNRIAADCGFAFGIDGCTVIAAAETGSILSRYLPPPRLAQPRRPERYRVAAEAAALRGNHVRAAVILAYRIPGEGLAKPRSYLKDGLLARLRPMLGWSDATVKRWIAALEPLLPYLAEGTWSRAARFLYELQKIPVDLEGVISVVDPIEWACTFGRRPLRRLLTRARTPILIRHLKRARDHLARTALPDADRHRLLSLLDTEIRTAEAKLHVELDPVFHGVFDAVGFVPGNRVESIARDKLIAELLDRLTDRGFLRFGDFRDTVARNSLKLTDIGPREWWTGDKLLLADRRLASELDGIYRGGEFYLRAIHRGTAVGFGTSVGRFLALYLVFPFLGAFLTVEAGKFLLHEFTALYGFLRRQMPQKPPDDAAIVEDLVRSSEEFAGAVPKSSEHGIALTPETLAVIGILGLVYLALMHLPAVRNWVGLGFRKIGQVVRWTLVSAPLAVWRSAPFVTLRKNRVVRFANRYFGTAFLAAAFVALLLTFFAAGAFQTIKYSAATFAIVFLIAITPTGRRFEDGFYEVLANVWQNFHANLLPGLISWIAWGFRAVAGAFERGLYSVDEWFRFRDRQSSGSYGVKVALAVVWFPVAYAFRFVFYLLVEPQVNPVKHFPIVTVSHKVIWPLLPQLAAATGSEWAALAVINGTPGIFGFVAWELKEDWRLYAANRTAGLPRVVLGHHGETMRGLLRPGFHSGTVPALFRKLRRALANAERTGLPASAESALHGLDGVRHAIEAFVERELLPLVNGSTAWAGLTLHCHRVRIGVQAIAIELDFAGVPFRIAFDREGDAIHFGISNREVLQHLTADQSAVLDKALGGFAEMGCANDTGPQLAWAEWTEYWGK